MISNYILLYARNIQYIYTVIVLAYTPRADLYIVGWNDDKYYYHDYSNEM